MAWRVSSETVMPRRSASWRSLASRSSGSLTVVRFMVCQHTYPDSGLNSRGPSSQAGVEGPAPRSALGQKMLDSAGDAPGIFKQEPVSSGAKLEREVGIPGGDR